MIVHVRGGESRQPVADPSLSGPITGAAIAAALVAGLLGAVAGPAAVVGRRRGRPVRSRRLAAGAGHLPVPGDAALHRGHRARLAGSAVATQRGDIGAGHGRRDGRRLCPGCERRCRCSFASAPWDVPLAAFVLLATVWPISSMLLRGLPPLAVGRHRGTPGVQAGRAPPAGPHHGTHPDAGALVHPADHRRGGRPRRDRRSPGPEHRTSPRTARHLVADRPRRVLGSAWHGDALERDCHGRLHRDRPDAACHVRGPWPAW